MSIESEVAQSCPTLCYPVEYSPPGSSIHGIFQARILELVAISFIQGIFPTQGLNLALLNSGRCFNLWTTREANCLLAYYFKFFLLYLIRVGHHFPNDKNWPFLAYVVTMIGINLLLLLRKILHFNWIQRSSYICFTVQFCVDSFLLEAEFLRAWSCACPHPLHLFHLCSLNNLMPEQRGAGTLCLLGLSLITLCWVTLIHRPWFSTYLIVC